MAGFHLPTANKGGPTIKVDDGLALARFNDIVQESHPDWAGTDKWGRQDDGERFRFLFTLVDDAHETLYQDGDPMDVDRLTNCRTGKNSNVEGMFEGLLTPQEFAQWKAATEPVDMSDLPGRVYNIKIAHNDGGYPFVEQVIGAAKPPKK